MFDIEDLRAEIKWTIQNSSLTAQAARRITAQTGSAFSVQGHNDLVNFIEGMTNAALNDIKAMAWEYGPPTRPLNTMHKILVAANPCVLTFISIVGPGWGSHVQH